MAEEKVSIKKIGLQYGMISGLVFIIVNVMLYAFDIEAYMKFGLLGGLAFFVCSALTIRQELKQSQNQIAFKTAFSGTFSVLLVFTIFALVYLYVLHNFIDPDLSVRMKELTIVVKEKELVFSNKSEEQIKQELKMMESFDGKISLKTVGQMFPVLLVMGSFFCAIMSLIAFLIFRPKAETPQLS